MNGIATQSLEGEKVCLQRALPRLARQVDHSFSLKLNALLNSYQLVTLLSHIYPAIAAPDAARSDACWVCHFEQT